jgi:hypothetical protein
MTPINDQPLEGSGNTPERQKNRRSDSDIDYRAEGADSGHETTSDTDRGYDEAVNSGPSRQGIPEGQGGVFGTTGGGGFGGGFQVDNGAALYDRTGEETVPELKDRHTSSRSDSERVTSVNLDSGSDRKTK